MLRNKNSRNFIAVLFAAFYLFVALFAQNFHDHGKGQIFKDCHFTKAEKTFTDASSVETSSDCLSCHLLYTGKYIGQEGFIFSAVKPVEEGREIPDFSPSFSSPLPSVFHSRGPPEFFP